MGTEDTRVPAPTADTGDACTALCDDGLECSADGCDDLGRCIHDPLTDCEWPAVDASGAVVLSDLDPDGDLRVSMSGAAWDPVSGSLWLVRNSGPPGIWQLAPDGAGGFTIAGEWFGLDGQDFEGLTVADPAEPYVVHLIEEDASHIVALDLSVPGTATEVGRWDVSSWVPRSQALGPEAIAFVPNEVLADQGFVDSDGSPYAAVGGAGGLFLVGTQVDGQVHAFDLFDIGIVVHVGAYTTARTDTSGLELDPVTGRLYVWHGNTNDLEVARLSSTGVGGGDRVLDTEYVFDMPTTGNQEGIAFAGDCAVGVRPLVIVTDDGAERSVLLYPDWPLGCG